MRGWFCGAAVCVVIVAAATAQAQPPTPTPTRAIPGPWRGLPPSVDGTPIGDPPGLAGRVSAVALIPGNPPTELIGTLGGIWKRRGDVPWSDVTNPSWPTTAVNSIAVDPSNPSVAYAGTGYDDVDDASVQPGAGVLKSVDGGSTWTTLSSTAPMRGYAVTGLAVDPLNDQIVVAATNIGLFRSTNAGTSWTEVLPITPGPYDVAEVRLAVDPATGDMLAGVAQSSGISVGPITTGHAIYRSTDGGLTWTAHAVDQGTGGGAVIVPAIATAAGHTYAYALDITGGAGSGVYTSADGGQTWSYRTIQDVTPKFTVAQIAVDPLHPATAYFAEASGPFSYAYGSSTAAVVKSRDGTQSSFGDWRALTVGPAAGGARAIYGGHDGGTVSYNLGTKSFTNDNRGLVSGIDYSGSALNAGLELSGAQDLGVDVFRGGPAVHAVYNADVFGALIDSLDPSTYWAVVLSSGGPAKFVVSHRGGSTGSWSTVPLSPAPSDLARMRVVQVAGDPRVLILPDERGTVYVSQDDGASWHASTPWSPGTDYVTSAAAALLPGEGVPVIYVGTQFGHVWRSGNLGASWTELSQSFAPLAVRGIAIDAAGSTGPSAEELFVGLGVYAPVQYAQTTKVGGVQRSIDSGASWTDIGQSLSGTGVNTLLLGGSTLLAGTDNGVWQYSGSGGAWSQAPGFPNTRVDDLFYSDDGKALFATTYGRGTLESTLVPVNATSPVISGTLAQGQKLKANAGSWSASPIRFSYQWQDCAHQTCSAIHGAHGQTYKLTRGDVGRRIQLVVTAANSSGTGGAAFSAPTAVVVSLARISGGLRKELAFRRSIRVTAAVAGRLRIAWHYKRKLIAIATTKFVGPGTGRIKPKLTAAGRSLAKRVKRGRLTARATFTMTTKPPVSVAGRTSFRKL